MTQTKGEILLGFYKKAKAKRIVATQEEFAGLLNYSRSQLIRFFNGPVSGLGSFTFIDFISKCKFYFEQKRAKVETPARLH